MHLSLFLTHTHTHARTHLHVHAHFESFCVWSKHEVGLLWSSPVCGMPFFHSVLFLLPVGFLILSVSLVREKIMIQSIQTS